MSRYVTLYVCHVSIPGGGGVEGGAPLSEHLCVARQQDPGQKPDQRHVTDDQEHLGSQVSTRERHD